MKYISLLILLTLISCNASKKVAKYNEDVKRGIASYIDQHPCVNDTVTKTKSDTIINTEFQIDTSYITIKDTVTRNINVTKTVIKTIKDTVTKIITDNQLVNFWRDSANAANRSNQLLQAKINEQTIQTKDAKHSANLRLYWLIGLVVAFGIWTFRKPLLKLIA
jgi:hypothetical protein